MRTTVVLSHVVIDEVHRDGEVVQQVGGAGAYAAVGIALVADAAPVLVSGVGRRDRDRITRWAADHGIRVDGLFDVGEQSPRTQVVYEHDDRRQETPLLGLDHFEAHTPLPRHLPVPPAEVVAAYVFHDADAAYWEEVEAFRSSSPAVLLWEVSAAACRPGTWSDVARRAGLVDVVSLNLAEGQALTGESSAAAVLAAVRELAPTVVLRLGAAGSMVTDRGRAWSVPAAPARLVDPTGGGNAYSGAFLQALADGADAERSARVASAVAADVVSAAGPPPVDTGRRRAVLRSADLIQSAPLPRSPTDPSTDPTREGAR